MKLSFDWILQYSITHEEVAPQSVRDNSNDRGWVNGMHCVPEMDYMSACLRRVSVIW